MILPRDFSWGKERRKPFIYYHGSDSQRPFKRFTGTEVWFDSVPRDYGTMDAEVYYRWKRPFVTREEDAEEHGLTPEQTKENMDQYRAWGGEANPQSFKNMRTLGYDFLVDEEGYAALYPERVKILRWITREGRVVKDYRSKRERKSPRLTVRPISEVLRGVR